MKIYARKNDWSFDMHLVFIDKVWESHPGEEVPKRSIGKMTFEVVEGFVPDDFKIPLRPEAAQMLMDELWQCGIRPTEGAGTAGAMAATQKHLEDMRKLVFEQPRIVNFAQPK